MNWKLKAKIQNIISLIPGSPSYEVYYWVQRTFGELRIIDPISELTAGITIWEKIAGNRYMYMNRLRHDDFIAIFATAGHRILLSVTDINKESEALLENELIKLDNRCKSKSRNVLSIIGSWIVSKKSEKISP